VRTHRPTRITTVVISLVLAAAAFGQPAPLSVAGGADGSTFSMIAAAAAKVLTSEIAGLEVVAVVSAGSIETIERILRGELDLGLAYGGDASFAYRGLLEFDVDEDPADEVRAIGFVYAARSLLVTSGDGEIERFEDLDGRRLAIGVAGSGDAVAGERLLRQTATRADVTPVFVGGAEALRLLAAGRVDAIHALVNEGDDATFAPLLRSGELRRIDSLRIAVETGLLDRFPFYGGAFDAHEAEGADAAAWGDAAIWVTRAGLSDDDVYRLTSALYGDPGLSRWHALAPEAAADTDAALHGISLPLHPGAARYWAERGVDIPGEALPVPRRDGH
jgi:uncharacterized protein